MELEKNAEFVEHWLETQAELAKFPLHELLASYLRLRGLQAAAAREHAALAAAAAAAMETLWELGEEAVEEEGECEDGNAVVLTKEARTAVFSSTACGALRGHLKGAKEKLTEDFSLYSWRAEVPLHFADNGLF